ncbi:MAG TPA: hypothetical protein VGQ83_26735 [Polyangia bacterium]|jgi:hypothetical protein
MGRTVSGPVLDWVREQLALGRDDAAVVVDARARFQLRPREGRTAVDAVRCEMRRTPALDPEVERGRILSTLRHIVHLALTSEPLQLRAATAALETINRMLGFNEAAKFEIVDGLSTTGALTSVQAIRARLEELEARAEAAPEPPESTEPSESDEDPQPVN